MKAIQTKFIGPTNTLGSRIIARCDGGKVTMSYDHALNSTQNHSAAAETLMRKMGWSGRVEAGTLPDGTMAHVFGSLDKEGDEYVKILLRTILHNLDARANPYTRPGVKDAIAYLNERAGDPSGWQSDAWQEVKR